MQSTQGDRIWLSKHQSSTRWHTGFWSQRSWMVKLPSSFKWTVSKISETLFKPRWLFLPLSFALCLYGAFLYDLAPVCQSSTLRRDLPPAALTALRWRLPLLCWTRSWGYTALPTLSAGLGRSCPSCAGQLPGTAPSPRAAEGWR